MSTESKGGLRLVCASLCHIYSYIFQYILLLPTCSGSDTLVSAGAEKATLFSGRWSGTKVPGCWWWNPGDASLVACRNYWTIQSILYNTIMSNNRRHSFAHRNTMKINANISHTSFVPRWELSCHCGCQ